MKKKEKAQDCTQHSHQLQRDSKCFNKSERKNIFACPALSRSLSCYLSVYPSVFQVSFITLMSFISPFQVILTKDMQFGVWSWWEAQKASEKLENWESRYVFSTPQLNKETDLQINSGRNTRTGLGPYEIRFTFSKIPFFPFLFVWIPCFTL